ncbi:MAG: hypothetical protein ABIK28_09995 [Planctomycetota bacterium]
MHTMERKRRIMELELSDHYRSLIDIQEGFRIEPNQSRRIPTVLEHLVHQERLDALTDKLSRLKPKDFDHRQKLLAYCFEGVQGIEDHLLDLFSKYYREDSPLVGCARHVRIAAAAALIQASPYEGLACFNPTLVPHPDQTRLMEGEVRIVMALRSYGEYHRSAISFRTGVIDDKGYLILDAEKTTENNCSVTVLPKVKGAQFVFPGDENLNSFVLYGPYMTDIGETWEDPRFTLFVGEGELNGAYLCTFTSFNLIKGRLQPSMIITRDFRTFDYKPLKGSGAEDKDLAFFPKKINNRYAVLSRNDGQDIYLMTSDDPFSYSKKKKVAGCRPDSFDAHKMGVCAPPIETEAGWLVIYHGVSDPGQIYSLSAMLLDLEDPSQVIARLPYTIHSPFFDEAGGMLNYINYTCGAMVHEATRSLIMPYAINDSYCKVGRISMDELIARLMDDGRTA